MLVLISYILNLTKDFITLFHGFHIALTCSSAKTESRAISEETRNYLSYLFKLSATNQSFEDFFSKLKEEIVFKFKKKIEQQINQIGKLKGKLERQAIVSARLKGKLLFRKTCQISWKLNVTTMSYTDVVPVFKFVE